LTLVTAVSTQAVPIVRQEKLPESSKEANVQLHVVGARGELIQQDPAPAAAANDTAGAGSPMSGKAKAGADPFVMNAGAMCSLDYPLGVVGRSECVNPEHTLILEREMCLEAARMAHMDVDPKSFTLHPEWGKIHPMGCFKDKCTLKATKTVSAKEKAAGNATGTGAANATLMQELEEAGECYFFNPVGCKPDEALCPMQGCDAKPKDCVAPMPNKPSKCLTAGSPGSKPEADGTTTELESCADGNSCLDGTPVCQRPKLLLADTPFDGSSMYTADGNCHFKGKSVALGYAVIMDEEACRTAADCVGLQNEAGEEFRVNEQNNSMYHDYPGGCFMATTQIAGKLTKHRVYFNPKPAGETSLPKNPKGVSLCNVTYVTVPESAGTPNNADVAVNLDEVSDEAFCGDDVDEKVGGRGGKGGGNATTGGGANGTAGPPPAAAAGANATLLEAEARIRAD